MEKNCINILFVLGLCIFNGIHVTEHEGRKTELPIAIFYEIAYFFSSVSF